MANQSAAGALAEDTMYAESSKLNLEIDTAADYGGTLPMLTNNHSLKMTPSQTP
jgi:hypothetical protein